MSKFERESLIYQALDRFLLEKASLAASFVPGKSNPIIRSNYFLMKDKDVEVVVTANMMSCELSVSGWPVKGCDLLLETYCGLAEKFFAARIPSIWKCPEYAHWRQQPAMDKQTRLFGPGNDRDREKPSFDK